MCRFLSQTCPASSLADLAELVLDMASVIVERSSLLPAILPGIVPPLAVFRIRIRIRFHRIHVFSGLPDSDPLDRGMDPDPALDPDPDPSITCKNNEKNLESYYFVTLFDFLSLKINVNVPYLPTVIRRKNCVKKLVFAGFLKVNDENSRIRIRTGSINQRHGSVDPDPDPHQNVMDPEHCPLV
jgi:hypothetical protein